VLIWGSGAYRKSSPRLACIPSERIEDRSALRYFAGLDSAGAPRWSERESDAAALADHDVVGELSAAWIEPVRRWTMLYNSKEPRGIVMRTASKPWGPWSDAEVVFQPWLDNGYGNFMHVSWELPERRDAFHDPNKQNVWAGAYGPYLIPRFAHGDARRCWIYYTLSSWNPYQVILARSEIGAPLDPPPPLLEKSTLSFGDAQWRKTSDDFYRIAERDGQRWLTTFAERKDADQGALWRWLPRDGSAVALRFFVRGGQAEAMLLEGGGDIPTDAADMRALYDSIKRGEYGTVVRCAWGLNDTETPVTVEWRLSPYDRANLKVAIIDALDSPWGFVGVSEIQMTRDSNVHPDRAEDRAARMDGLGSN